jgi:hypothetical protein
MRNKKPAKICDARFLPGGEVVLTFTRPHGVMRAGQVMELHNGPHTVVSVQNKFILTARKWEWWRFYLVRLKIAWKALTAGAKKVRGGQ